MRTLHFVLRLAILGALLLVTGRAADEIKKSYDLPAADAATALKQFSDVSGRETLFAADIVRGVRTAPVKGKFTAKEALDHMLAGTGLTALQDDKTGALAVMRVTDPNAPRAALTKNSDRPGENSPAELNVVKLDTFEVMGSKLLNMDVKRSVNDAQPYVIFDRAVIERSGAVSLDDFLKQRLTMNTQGLSNNQASAIVGPTSQINLRGLGTNQTLILIDGHRAASPVTLSGVTQSDLAGIPLAAVERVEVLPTTASGIYGGSATGGVVNIILRRDYAGAELKTTYDNSFSTDTAIRTVDLSLGFTLEHGKTNVLFAAHYSGSHSLAVQDRSFLARGRAIILANNPGNFLAATTPPLGLTTNIRSANGSALFGAGSSNITFVPVGYQGGGGLTPLRANAGSYNLGLANNAVASGGGRNGLLNGPTLESLTATIRRQLTAKLQAFVEFSASNNTGYFPASNTQGTYTINATAPNNPFGQALSVKVPVDLPGSISGARNNDRRAVGGVILRLPGDWSAEADYTWDNYRTTYRQFNALSGAESALIANGTLDVLRDLNVAPLNFSPYLVTDLGATPFPTSLGDAALRLSGPVWSLPAGAPTLSGSLEHRDEWFVGAYQFVNATRTDFFPSRSQSVDSAYLEVKVPLVAAKNNFPLIHSLEFQAAGRRDDYSIHGTTGSVTVGSTAAITRTTGKLHSSNPTVGLRYEPVSSLLLRTSYGTGFLPPTVQQLVPTPPSGAFIAAGFFTDPHRGNEANAANQVQNVRQGGNPGLQPEKSKSWSAGLVLTPACVSGLRLSVDYTHIDKTDNITTISGQNLVNNEAYLPGRVIRGPVPAGDPFGVGRITGLDISLVNISRAVVEAYDMTLDYELKTAAAGSFDFYLLATRLMHSKTQVVVGAPIVENVGIQGLAALPTKWKANAGLTWTHRPWTLGWSAHYFDSYLVSTAASVLLNQGGDGRVRNQICHDIFGSYRFGASRNGEAGAKSSLPGARLLNGTEVQIGIRNVFNTVPPFDAGNNSNLYSALGDPRLASYYVSLKKAF